METEIKRLLKESGNPWGVDFEQVQGELMSTYFTKITGFKKMVWTTAHMDRNHWLPEDPLNSEEVYVANQFRAANPTSTIRPDQLGSADDALRPPGVAEAEGRGGLQRDPLVDEVNP